MNPLQSSAEWRHSRVALRCQHRSIKPCYPPPPDFTTQDIAKLGGRIETSSPARHIAQTNSTVDVYSDSGIYGAK